ncbi:MAG: hypothetical protein BWY43_00310 [candidate division WS2 bacterium ADurb.Bin280]|uniref:Uncharacterized protein n=1 Tax=candidate division WS2 bacterium ADurb.Bin280 TaxID=1852829 RepID=A0A1V5SF91_9BACT|nr:MAG: hypothetical protein BWY43_00310 [candidate division WS2 bacterium ADurb.Bin280]
MLEFCRVCTYTKHGGKAMSVTHSWQGFWTTYTTGGVVHNESYQACKHCGIKKPLAHEQAFEDHVCLGIKEPEAKVIRDLLLDTGVIHRFETPYRFCWQEIITGPIRRFLQLEAGKAECYRIQDTVNFYKMIHLDGYYGSGDQAVAVFIPTTGHNAIVWGRKTIVVPQDYRYISATPPDEGECTLHGVMSESATGLLIRLD